LLKGCVRQTTGGAVIVGSVFPNAVDGNLFAIKLDRFGEIAWKVVLGGSSTYEVGFAIQQAIDGGFFIAGYIDDDRTGKSNGVLIKLTATGTYDSSKLIGATTERSRGYAIEKTVDNGFVITGQAGNSRGAQYDGDILFIKLSALGDVESQHSFGGLDTSSGQSVQQAKDGSYVIAGSYVNPMLMQVSESGVILQQKIVQGLTGGFSYIQPTSDNGYIAIGAFRVGTGTKDAFIMIVKLNPFLEIDWSKACGDQSSGSVSYAAGVQIKEVSSGGFIATGASLYGGDRRVVVMRLDSEGQFLWQRILDHVEDPGGYAYSEYGTAITEAEDGGFLLTGNLEIPGLVPFVAKIDSVGTIDICEDYWVNVTLAEWDIPINLVDTQALSLFRISDAPRNVYMTTQGLTLSAFEDMVLCDRSNSHESGGGFNPYLLLWAPMICCLLCLFGAKSESSGGSGTGNGEIELSSRSERAAADRSSAREERARRERDVRRENDLENFSRQWDLDKAKERAS